MIETVAAVSQPDSVARSTLREFVAYFLRLGTLGFGGPIAPAGSMQRDLVEQRCWIAEAHSSELRAQIEPGKGSAFQVRIPMAMGKTH